ncbi:hypothetical protein BN59_03208 [Legionella massiliensis]|uniref:Uncharacterized protein n=1 Tax=Legionella massiliensis TaxID=1034943 RepID=A0A078L4Q6_9GAMM|nr:DUF4785 domain-containing protein [Legionella massiliensis]CDZ78893.1 hypothetical protein BN59_03208 [Legionella massiliensis]CEE14631.1 hypothetical protein BN1094_03208 [Legionella massiliensis]
MRLSSLIFLSVTTFSQAQAFSLANDIAVKPYNCTICESLSREPLSLTWATKNRIMGHDTLRKQTSRKYQVKASFQELRQGIAIYSEAPGAIVRITPVNPAQKFKPEFRIRNATNKKSLSLKEASSQFLQSAALQDSPLTENTLAFAELKPELDSGKLILSSSSPIAEPSDERSDYIVQLYDKNSLAYLSIETDKTNYQYGDELRAKIVLRDDKLNYPLENISATLIDSAGKRTALTVTELSANTFQTKTTLASNRNDKGENWYIEVYASTVSDNKTIYRQAHSSFSYRIPSAAIREIKMVKPDSLEFKANIEVATGSRYALQAVLFGTDSKGELRAIQTVQSATWLATGENSIDFSFDKTLNAGFQAPYYLGYLHLTDYGQNRPVFEYDSPIELSKLG